MEFRMFLINCRATLISSQGLSVHPQNSSLSETKHSSVSWYPSSLSTTPRWHYQTISGPYSPTPTTDSKHHPIMRRYQQSGYLQMMNQSITWIKPSSIARMPIIIASHFTLKLKVKINKASSSSQIQRNKCPRMHKSLLKKHRKCSSKTWAAYSKSLRMRGINSVATLVVSHLISLFKMVWLTKMTCI